MLDKLTRIFGEKAGAQSGNDCFKNAVHNAALAIYNGDRPKIFDVNTQNGRHAYLGGGDGSVISQGLTWKTDFYPELNKN